MKRMYWLKKLWKCDSPHVRGPFTDVVLQKWCLSLPIGEHTQDFPGTKTMEKLHGKN